MNTRINYLYRDASNYKVPNDVIVSGIFSSEQISEIISCLDSGEFFIPSKVGFTEKKFEEETEDDHPWFELQADDFEFCNEEPTLNVSPDELVHLFQKEKDHWEEGIYDAYV